MIQRSLIALLLLGLAACNDAPAGDVAAPDAALPEGDTAASCTVGGEKSWQVLATCRPDGELFSVWSGGPSDVWAVGAGGQVLHFDGCAWSRLDPKTDADLWWVFGLPSGPVYMVGAKGTALRYTAAGGFEAMPTGVAVTLYGIWGTAEDDLWTVGFANDDASPSALLRWDGAAWTQAAGLPAGVDGTRHFFKVWGSGKDDVWIVGSSDLIVHWDGKAFSLEATGQDEDWITVAGHGATAVIVGGRQQGRILERQAGAWKAVGPSDLSRLQGVCVQPDGTALATGFEASMLARAADGTWTEVTDAPFDLFNPANPPQPDCQKTTPDYHACASDGHGGWFLVGGDFLAISEGTMLYYGPKIPGDLP